MQPGVSLFGSLSAEKRGLSELSQPDLDCRDRGCTYCVFFFLKPI